MKLNPWWFRRLHTKMELPTFEGGDLTRLILKAKKNIFVTISKETLLTSSIGLSESKLCFIRMNLLDAGKFNTVEIKIQTNISMVSDKKVLFTSTIKNLQSVQSSHKWPDHSESVFLMGKRGIKI